MWFSESFWRNLWFFVPFRCLLSCVLYISHIFSTGSYNWFCTLIWSCLISSVWSHLLIWSYIFSSILSSVRSFHKFSWVFLCSCKSVVWKTLMELPLVRPLLVPVFFFSSSFSDVNELRIFCFGFYRPAFWYFICEFSSVLRFRNGYLTSYRILQIEK